MREQELIIIGAGPAGISAVIAAQKRGLEQITVIDRLPVPGGMLTQCFHRGFGKGGYGTEMTGPEFTSRLLLNMDDTKIKVLTETFVLDISIDRVVSIANERGVYRYNPKAIVLATGCRERPVGALPVYGNRPTGVFTAGSVQRMINLSGYRIGKRAVVLGSGDVGMIVAHHLTETGTEVIAVIEKQKSIGGLARNKTRYLDAHNIPVITGSTIDRLHGTGRLEGVTVCEVDANGNPVPETGYRVDCDTLITSVGLIPELELAGGLGLDFSGDRIQADNAPQTALPWLFVCGNANRVHSMVDSVVTEGTAAGTLAADYILRSFTKN